MSRLWGKVRLNLGNTRFFSRNTGPKIISIVFAIVMWLYVMGEVNPQSIIELQNVPVQLLNIEELEQSGLVIMGQKDFSTKVKVAGRRNDVYKVRPQDLVATADLRGFHKGLNSVPVEVSVPTNTSVVDVSPRQIKVTLDAIVKRQKPIKVIPFGTTANGFEPGVAKVSPNEVIVEGPESLVNSVTKVVASINVKDRQEDIVETLPIKAVNRDGKEVNGVEVKNRYVEVKLPILRVKEVPLNIEYQGSVQEGYTITKASQSIRSIKIRGRKETIEAINQIGTKPISLTGLTENVIKDIEPIVPKDVELVLKDNIQVNIQIEPIEEKILKFEPDEILIKNLGKNLKATVDKELETLSVKVRASKSDLSTIQKEDIELYVDADKLEKGSYYVSIAYNFPGKSESISIDPKQIDISIDEEKESIQENEQEKEE